MPLALVIFLIGLLIWQKVRHEDEWKLRDQVYVFVLLTAAMLIKGPIVYAFLLPGIALFQLHRGRTRPARAPKTNSGSAWPGWWPWVASLAILLITSKRVDRIFPVIPPLCLLLAAQLAPRTSCSHGPAGRSSRSIEPDEAAHRAVAIRTALPGVYWWSTIALAFAILFTGGYT